MRSRLRPVAVGAAHLTVLSSFALAQPLFDLLARNAEFFAARGSTPTEIVVFAVALTLLPPAALATVELVAALLSGRLQAVLHLLFIGALAGVVALQALKRLTDESGRLLLVYAALAGAAFALAYWRASAWRTFLTILTPAPVLFLVLFLFNSPVSKLVLVSEAQARAAEVDADVPVVVVIFDEFATAAIMNRRERVDARRFPSFAALARTSTWYRNATTVHPHTDEAVPAILTGVAPRRGTLPTRADHPNSLFTLLARDYDMKARETLTSLCPAGACEALEPRELSARAESLVSDVAVVYGHVVLPDALAARLPPVTQGWTDFRGRDLREQEAEAAAVAARRRDDDGGFPACARGVCAFVDAIAPSERPTLYFLHVLLPHLPWHFLPSGRRYGAGEGAPGLEQGRWREDEWLVAQGHQRYLLQAGYTDRALGLLLGRLRDAGIFDDTLLVVTSDHGMSFTPGQPPRLVTARNLAELAFVPLFVKLPRQTEGRIDDSFARTVDIVPTIADVLGVPLPWQADGRSLLARRPRDGRVVLPNHAFEPMGARLSALVEERRRALTRQIGLFGTGSFAQAFRIGPNPELYGADPGAFRVERAGGARVELDGGGLLQAYDPDSALSPTYVSGEVVGASAQRLELAVALNGAVAALTRTYRGADGKTRFAALLPEQALRRGRNDVAVYAVRTAADETVLAELAGGTVTYRLVRRGGRELLEGSGATRAVVERRAVRGTVAARRAGETVSFTGWAVVGDFSRPADRVVVLVDGRSVFSARAGTAKQKTLRREHGLERAGFSFEVPASLLPERGGGAEVRVFAVAGGRAAELEYAPTFPWRAR